MEKYSHPHPVLHRGGVLSPLGRLARPSVHHRLNGDGATLRALEPGAADCAASDSRNVFSHGSGGQKYKIKVWAKPCSF